MLENDELMQAELLALGVSVRALIASHPDHSAYLRALHQELDLVLSRFLAGDERQLAAQVKGLVELQNHIAGREPG